MTSAPNLSIISKKISSKSGLYSPNLRICTLLSTAHSKIIGIVSSDSTEETIPIILQCAVESNVQVRRMGEYKPDLEDIFLLIMDKLGAEVKTTSDLMTSEHIGEVNHE